MAPTGPTIEYTSFEHDAPEAIWQGVSRVYLLGFTGPPYDESPDELRQVQQWGPEMLAAPGGRLVVATRDEQVVGFVISEGLDRDEPWQRLLATVSDQGADAPRFPPSETVIIQELAVDGAQRGQGIARGLVTRLLAGRAESEAVLSVYGRAEPVHAMYLRWGFSELGTAPAEDSDDTLHIMAMPLPWDG